MAVWGCQEDGQTYRSTGKVRGKKASTPAAAGRPLPPLVAAATFRVGLQKFYISVRTDRQLEGRSLFSRSVLLRKTVILQAWQ